MQYIYKSLCERGDLDLRIDQTVDRKKIEIVGKRKCLKIEIVI